LSNQFSTSSLVILSRGIIAEVFQQLVVQIFLVVVRVCLREAVPLAPFLELCEMRR
jgi:hypothetical protein